MVVVGLVNLLEACNQCDYTAFINTGSSSEYGLKDKIMNEEDVCHPLNAYGISKYAATLYASFTAKTQSHPIITLRLFSPFGPYDDKSRFVTYAIIQAMRGEEMQLANPDSVRDFIYSEDVIDAYINSMDKTSRHKGEIFNIGSGRESKISEAVSKILELTGSKSSVIWNAQSPRSWESVCWQADISKAKKLLGWQPKYDLNSGLIKTVAWFKKNQQFYANQ
ncbi:MAG: dTDP-glucose 4,6-dehydratase [Parcubacteria group bacterium GW2011_GWC2_32_10]|nr:MAG: dTDP-glucose 4,6-dehydratase [Parcubacteria group bacterium GW2011_GWC2_32_10]